MEYLSYDLFEDGYVNRFLVSEKQTQRMVFTPVTMEGDINLWLKEGFSIHDNPCKSAYAEAQRACEDCLPESAALYPGGAVVNRDGTTQRFSLYFPFDDPALDLSCCFDEPTRISVWAAVSLECARDEAAVFDVQTCGGLTLFCNGVRAVVHKPYTRNILQPASCTLPLVQGRNTILVHLDDLAERDAVFMLRMRYMGLQAVRQCIPLQPDRQAANVHSTEALLRSLGFTRNHFTHGNVTLSYVNPLGLEVKLTYRCATEENEMSGVFAEGQVMLLPGRGEVSLGAVTDFPIGFLRFTIAVMTDGISVGSYLTAEIHPDALIPPPDARIALRKEAALHFLADYGEMNTNRAVAILVSGGDMALAHKLIRQQITKINSRHDCSDFYLIYFPYIIQTYRHTEKLPEALAQEMEDCILHFRYWMDEPGNDVMWFFSENHALLFHACRLLAGELYPDRVFSNSGLTGGQMTVKAKRLLDGWFTSFFAEGFTEWNSSAYLPIDMLGFASIYAFSKEKSLRDKARRGMDTICLLLAQHSLGGILAASAGRTYPKELFGNLSNCTSAVSYICFGCGTLSHAGKGIVSLCLSDYEPPADYMQYLSLPASTMLEIYSVHGYQKHVSLYTAKTSDYLFTAAIDFRPGMSGYQENPFHLAFSANAQLFINHPGEKAIFGCGRPSYWAGNGRLPRVQAYKGLAAILFSIPDAHPVDFTHMYFPTMELDEWKWKRGILFGRYGSGYCAVVCSRPMKSTGSGANGGREWTAEGRNVIWLVYASCASKSGSFGVFMDSVLHTSFVFDNELLAFTIKDSSRGELTGGWSQRLCRDGQDICFPEADQYGTSVFTEEHKKEIT